MILLHVSPLVFRLKYLIYDKELSGDKLMTMPKGWKPPDDKKQVQTAENFEDKKWLVDRFEVGIRSAISEVTVAREQAKSYSSRIEVNLKVWRNSILTAVTFAAAIILGVASGFPTEIQPYSQLMIILIVADILIGVTAFFIIGILRENANSLIVLRDGAFLLTLHRIYYLENYFNLAAVSIHETSIKRLEFFTLFNLWIGSIQI